MRGRRIGFVLIQLSKSRSEAWSIRRPREPRGHVVDESTTPLYICRRCAGGAPPVERAGDFFANIGAQHRDGSRGCMDANPSATSVAALTIPHPHPHSRSEGRIPTLVQL